VSPSLALVLAPALSDNPDVLDQRPTTPDRPLNPDCLPHNHSSSKHLAVIPEATSAVKWVRLRSMVVLLEDWEAGIRQVLKAIKPAGMVRTVLEQQALAETQDSATLTVHTAVVVADGVETTVDISTPITPNSLTRHHSAKQVS
jgi:hypothetical protein